MNEIKIRSAYVAGAFTDRDTVIVVENCRKALEVAGQIGEMGIFPVVPHVALPTGRVVGIRTAVLEGGLKGILLAHLLEEALWTSAMEWCLDQMARQDCVVLVPGWRESKGAVIERAVANLLGIQVFDGPEELRSHLLSIGELAA